MQNIANAWEQRFLISLSRFFIFLGVGFAFFAPFGVHASVIFTTPPCACAERYSYGDFVSPSLATPGTGSTDTWQLFQTTTTFTLANIGLDNLSGSPGGLMEVRILDNLGNILATATSTTNASTQTYFVFSGINAIPIYAGIPYRLQTYQISGSGRFNYDPPNQSLITAIFGTDNLLNQATLVNPSQGEILEDFYAWTIEASLSTSTTPLFIGVEYGTSTFSEADILQTYSPQSYLITQIPKTTNLISSSTPGGTSWQARTYVSSDLAGLNRLYTASTTIFYPFGVGQLPQPVSSTNPYAFCAQQGDIATRGFCNVLVFTFIPQQITLNGFANLQSLVLSKPPFGYLSLIKDELEGFSTSTPNVVIPSITTYFGTILNPLIGGIVAILWLLFVLWIVRRFQTLEL